MLNILAQLLDLGEVGGAIVDAFDMVRHSHRPDDSYLSDDLDSTADDTLPSNDPDEIESGGE